MSLLVITPWPARSAGLTCGLLLAACRTEAIGPRPAPPPLHSVETFGRTMRLTLQPGITPDRAFDDGLFAGVKDHPPLEELRQRFGEPASRWTDRYAEQWYRFRAGSHTVEAGWESQESNGPRTTAWGVYSVTSKPLVSSVIPAVAAELARNPEASNLIVGAADGSEAVSCERLADQTARCVWFTSAKEATRGP